MKPAAWRDAPPCPPPAAPVRCLGRGRRGLPFMSTSVGSPERLPERRRGEPFFPALPPSAAAWTGAAGAGTATVTGTPLGVRAPVIRVSSTSPGRIFVVVGRIPATVSSRLTSRRWSGRTSVTTVPDSPARAVRPPRCR